MMKYFLICVNLLVFLRVNAQWEPLHFPCDSVQFPNIESIDFLNSSFGLAVGWQSVKNEDHTYLNRGMVTETLDGGINWDTKFTLDSARFFGVVCLEASNFVTYGEYGEYNSNRGVILRKESAGDVWDTLIIPFKIFGGNFPSNDIGYLCGKQGKFLKTIDSGRNWELIEVGVTDDLNNCYFLNDTIGFITGKNIFLKTINGGLNWSIQYFNNSEGYIIDVVFPSFNAGYFIMSELGNGKHLVYKSVDLGDNWEIVDTLSGGFLSSLYFINDSMGYAPGQFQIQKTMDGGYSWEKQTSNPISCWPEHNSFFDDLREVLFINGTGFAAGYGQFYRIVVDEDKVPVNTSSPTDRKYFLDSEVSVKHGFDKIEVIVNGDHLSLDLYDLNGKLLLKRKLNKGITELETDYLKQGVFFMKIYSDRCIKVYKFIRN